MVFVKASELLGTCTSLTSHPAKKFVIDLMRVIVIDSFSLSQSAKATPVLDLLLEVGSVWVTLWGDKLESETATLYSWRETAMLKINCSVVVMERHNNVLSFKIISKRVLIVFLAFFLLIGKTSCKKKHWQKRIMMTKLNANYENWLWNFTTRQHQSYQHEANKGSFRQHCWASWWTTCLQLMHC